MKQVDEKQAKSRGFDLIYGDTHTMKIIAFYS
jgi:hypothetical protein